MNTRDLHRQAIILVKTANAEKEKGNKERYRFFLQQAFEFEKTAAEKLRDNLKSEPTRSVLYRSAANLAIMLKDIESARELASEGLRGEPHFEIRMELQNVLDGIELKSIAYPQGSYQISTTLKPVEVEFDLNPYVLNLRGKAMEFRIKETSDKYGGAVRISHAIDFLNNVQNSYSNYADIKFRKTYVPVNPDRKYETLANKFRKNSSLLAVDLNYKSFGISIAADDGLMDHIGIHNKDVTNMQNLLFEDFKKDVILPDYNSQDFQREISQKFSPEERKRIFSPIQKSINNGEGYTLSLTTDDYTKEIKKFRTLTSVAQETLVPEIEVPKEPEASLIKTVSQKIGGKKKTLIAEDLKKAEFDKKISEVKTKDKAFHFSDPYQILVKFDNGKFSIIDENLEIDVYANDGQEIFNLYSTEFIDKYTFLLENVSNLSLEQQSILDKFQGLGMRDW